MSTEAITIEKYRQKTATNRLGLWLFILSDAFVFAGLFVARFYLLGTELRPEVNQLLGLVVTSVLLASSFFINRAETVSRGWLILLWFGGIVFSEIFRFGLRHGVYALRRRGHLLVPAVLVNADPEGYTLLEQLQEFQHSGMNVIGFVDSHLPRGHVIGQGCCSCG